MGRLAKNHIPPLVVGVVWAAVFFSVSYTGRHMPEGGVHRNTPLVLAGLGAAGAGVLAWRFAARAPKEKRATYYWIAGTVHLIALTFALTTLVPTEWSYRVGAFGITLSAAAFALALMRLPDDSWDLAAHVRRGLDGLFIGASVVLLVWLVFGRDFYYSNAGDLTPTPIELFPPLIAETLLFGIGIGTTLRLRRWRKLHAWTMAAVMAVQVCAVGVLTTWQLHRATSFSIWWSVAFAGFLGALLLVTAAARGARPARDEEGKPVWHYGVYGFAAGADVLVLLVHTLSGGVNDLPVIALACACAVGLGARLLLTYLDVKRLVAEAESREEHLAAIVDASSDAVVIIDEDFAVLWVSESSAWTPDVSAGGSLFSAISFSDRSFTQQRLREFLAETKPGARCSFSFRLEDREGRMRRVEVTVTDRRRQRSLSGIVLRLVDVAERHQLEMELARLAYSDPLTGLANRRALLSRLEEVAFSSGEEVTLMLLDLDGFKNVNDTRGHDKGDEILVEVSQRIADCLRPTDVAARLGGDEFAVMLRATWAESRDLAELLVEHLGEPYDLGDSQVEFVTASVGLAPVDESVANPQTLLRNADLALRAAKQSGKNRCATYDASFDERVQRHNDIMKKLRGAIHRGELDVVYQPIFSRTEDGDLNVEGAEALVRWRHPELGSVSPAEFIPAASEAGLTHDLAVWMVGRVARQLSQWRELAPALWISVNVSVKELHTYRFAQAVSELLIEHGIRPNRLVIEVTEHDFSTQVATLIAQLSALRGTGVSIALDDFGAGYSSLNQLDRLPIDIVKIDRDLVAKDDGGLGDLAPVIIDLGDRLGLTVIAEGVETSRQLELITARHSPLLQGYLLAKPMGASEFEAGLPGKDAQRATERSAPRAAAEIEAGEAAGTRV
ncbi:putative bifunctional diguanylate cyclase/phosphodiesterase [Salininema proteolyticum]|uniref:Bifunctional diguanylate cyclase/phosphodiesterase n=1 Tax=Salininema proteolyticum TaxID=1607685 RepID=A0ABV8U044_9ACTN